MIKIQCSILEQVRKDPKLFGQLLASKNPIRKGGTHGMLAYWQDVVQKVHLGNLSGLAAVKELQKCFSRFDRNSSN